MGNKFKVNYGSKERVKGLEILDKIYELSPESQEDVLKYIEMCYLWEKEKKNPKGSGKLDIKE